MFRRKKATNEPETPKTGVYIMDDGEQFRLFLVGNAPLRKDEFTSEERAVYRQLLDSLYSAIGAEPNIMSNQVRIYKDYVALAQHYGTTRPGDALRAALELLSVHLGWEAMPILGNLTSLEEYQSLNESFGRRWNIGHY